MSLNIQILKDPSKKGDCVAAKEELWKRIVLKFNSKRPAERHFSRKFLEGILKVFFVPLTSHFIVRTRYSTIILIILYCTGNEFTS